MDQVSWERAQGWVSVKGHAGRRGAVQTKHIDREAIAESRLALYIMVNNRSDGNAPLTIQSLRDELKTVQHDWVVLLFLTRSGPEN